MIRRPSAATLLWWSYCGFVIYGSLVPLEFNPMPIDEAWRRFQHAPLLEIGAEHRADWISNIVLFVPVGFLSGHALLRAWRNGPRVPVLLLALAFCLALALAIEFAQVFFPPRTVALNDLFAEAVGGALGLALAARYSAWFAVALESRFDAARRIDSRWLALYAFCYVALSLFPYDFVMSAAEWDSKLDSPSWGWLLARSTHGIASNLLKLGAETMAVAPIGWWLAARAQRPLTTSAAAGLGALLGVGIELAQFFMLSGISQGLSVLSRAVGVALGARLWQRRSEWSLPRLATAVRRRWPWAVLLYTLLLLQVNHWLSARWQGSAAALQQLHELHFLPFYYHYYTTEMAALASLAAATLVYAPIGAGTWVARRSGAVAAGVALLAATVVETGKLFMGRIHPDPTNLLIACVAAWGAHALLGGLERSARTPAAGGAAPAPAQRTYSVAPTLRSGRTRRPVLPALAWPVAIAAAAWGVADFPVQPGLIAALLAAVVVTVWLRPALAFLVVPALLPVLDLAPWSGRILVDEFDLLVLVAFATAWLRGPVGQPVPPDRVLRAVTLGVALALGVGVLRGVLPWQGSETVAFEALHGPLNTLRVAKGAVWAMLGCLLWRRMASAAEPPWRALQLGVASGLALTVAVIVWERATFVSLLDFESTYRVTGAFSAMHIGGAYVEAFLVVTLPFLLALILQARHIASRLGGAALLAGGVYAVMVTFSRSGQAALAVATAVMLVAVSLAGGRRLPRLAWAGALAALMVLVAVPVLRGPFVQARAAAADDDLDVRSRHWADVIAMRPSDLATQLAGNGLGRFAEAHYWAHDPQHRAGIFHLHRESTPPFLRLGSGLAIYVEQFVAVQPRQDYTLRLDARASSPNAQTTVSLCEKSLLTSFDCVQATVDAGPVANQWRSVELKINSGPLGDRPWYASRPVKLSLQNAKQALAFDVAGLRLQDAEGRELLLNGDFSHAMDHWFFAADDHLPWHAKNLPLAVWFDLGWLGVAAFGALFAVAAVRATSAAAKGSLGAAAALAALAGFGVIGLFDTVIDAPRFLLLCLALCASCCAGRRETRDIGATHE